MYKDILSPKRLSKYVLNTNESDDVVISRYLWNIALAESFFPVIAIFEVVLRNKIYDSVSKNIQMAWVDENTSFIDPVACSIISKVKRDLAQEGKTVTQDLIISNLTLGFWVNLFKKTYMPALWTRPNVFSDVFPNFNASGVMDRVAYIRPYLKNILNLRNRISHHETIYDNPIGIDNIYNDMMQILEYLSLDSLKLVNHVSRFKQVYQDGSSKFLGIYK